MSDQINGNEQVEGAAPEPAAKASPGEPLVYGLDGQEPVGLKEYSMREMQEAPAFAEQMDAAMRTTLESAESPGSPSGQPEAGGEDWRQRYVDLLQDHQSIARYGNIINAMENDPRLVDVMQRAIAGDVAARDRRAESNSYDFHDEAFYDDDSDDEPSHDGRSAKSDAQKIAAAKEQGAREAMVRVEIQNAMNEMMEAGGSADELQAFQEFLVNPSGLSAHDFLALFRSRNSRAGSPASKKVNKELPPAPLAGANGQTDRPSDTPYVETGDAGHRFYSGDPNKF